MVLQALKDRVARAYAARSGIAVVVGSLGRSGSSMLTRACAQGLLRLRDSDQSREDPRGLVQTAWSLDVATFQRGFVYKTHDYPSNCVVPPAFVRFLYTYADPVDVVISLARQGETRGLPWLEKHADHMKVTITDFDRLYVEDIFALERHFDAWIGCTSLPLIAIRYDTLWNHQQLISDFLRFKLLLPPYVPRSRSIPPNSQSAGDDVRQTYGRLRQKVALQSIYVSPLAVSLLGGDYASASNGSSA